MTQDKMFSYWLNSKSKLMNLVLGGYLPDNEQWKYMRAYINKRIDAATTIDNFTKSCVIINQLGRKRATFTNDERFITLNAYRIDKHGFKVKVEFKLDKRDPNHYDALIANFERFCNDMKFTL